MSDELVKDQHQPPLWALWVFAAFMICVGYSEGILNAAMLPKLQTMLPAMVRGFLEALPIVILILAYRRWRNRHDPRP